VGSPPGWSAALGWGPAVGETSPELSLELEGVVRLESMPPCWANRPLSRRTALLVSSTVHQADVTKNHSPRAGGCCATSFGRPWCEPQPQQSQRSAGRTPPLDQHDGSTGLHPGAHEFQNTFGGIENRK